MIKGRRLRQKVRINYKVSGEKENSRPRQISKQKSRIEIGNKKQLPQRKSKRSKMILDSDSEDGV